MNIPGYKLALCVALVFALSAITVALSDGPELLMPFLTGMAMGTLLGAGVMGAVITRSESRLSRK